MKNNDWNNWIRYSTLGIEMAVIIGFAVWGGVSLDKGRERRFTLFTLLLTAARLIVAKIIIVKGIKD